MDGIHDMGGMAGFNEISIEANEPIFHAAWEARAFAMNILAIAALGAYNTDEYRHALERMQPQDYLEASYYERVLTGVATLLVEKGFITEKELNDQVAGHFMLAQANADVKDDGKKTQAKPRFSIADRVQVLDNHPNGHTRVPDYVRGHQGEVVHVAAYFSYPDAAAHGLPYREEPTYHVLFKVSDLWHDSQASTDTVVVDLWESYLEIAS